MTMICALQGSPLIVFLVVYYTFSLYFTVYAIIVVPAFSPFAHLHPAPSPSLRNYILSSHLVL